ncbi:hypothetical protein J31TS4_12680 [Paenibacillus sp. J31TS4]|uniref:M67 family metallopeptidase n=1 Tax=Paenibacillus sp. J31TS4 TaxID=2807195 RepID=UPI001B098DD9|nr:M67 family metallopeptidase [Paenibacillus sp. J31TS4]GIP37988.1 hypothetical protein J31TS4_12680 [Paenibacillus sp. J31TS4]
MNRVACAEELAARLLAYCEACRPLEGCGVLWGSRDADGLLITGYQPLANRANNPAQAFLLDPAEWVPLLLQAEASQPGAESPVGLFHSHPSSAAIPSAEDLASEWPLPTYWIAGFPEERHPELAAYERTGKGIRRQTLVLLPSPCRGE